MGSYLLRRLTLFIPMLIGITIITFLVANLAPGDPVSALISPEDQLREEDLERMRKALGLDKPIPVRYVIWVKELVTGNFGFSYFTKQPVMDRIGPRLLPTIELTGIALVLSLLMGVVFGVISALRQYSFWDYALSVLSLIGLSIPTFFFGLVALLLFGLIWPSIAGLRDVERRGNYAARQDLRQSENTSSCLRSSCRSTSLPPTPATPAPRCSRSWAPTTYGPRGRRACRTG